MVDSVTGASASSTTELPNVFVASRDVRIHERRSFETTLDTVVSHYDQVETLASEGSPDVKTANEKLQRLIAKRCAPLKNFFGTRDDVTEVNTISCQVLGDPIITVVDPSS